MNYLKIYIKLIRNSQIKQEPESYEKHHIFPKSVYGENKHIIKLSPREHYIAHAILYKGFKKRYGEKHYKTIKMAKAFLFMHSKNSYQKCRYINSRLYEKLKEDYYKYNPFCRKGKNHPSYGFIRSKETKEKQGRTYSQKYSKENSPMYGKHWCNDGVKNTIAFKCPKGFNKGRLSMSAKTKEKISKASRGRKLSDRTREKMKKAQQKRSLEGTNKHCVGRKWYTNEFKTLRAFECPPGFKPGRKINDKF